MTLKTLLLCLTFLIHISCNGDPAPAPVNRMVSLPDGGQVEVLDWGGSGPSVVLLHGSGDSAYEFGDFAPLLTGEHHVVSLSRRGSSRSSAFPEGGSLSLLTNDIAVVLDSLRLDRVVLVGHSYAGRELTAFGTSHPERLRGLVYFDAAYTANGADVNPTLNPILSSLEGSVPPPAPASIDALGSYLATWGCTYSREALTRITQAVNAADSASQRRLGSVAEPASYRGYAGPVLALRARWPLPGSPKAIVRDTIYTPHIQRFAALMDTVWTSFRADVPQARYLEIHDSGHCIHASQPAATASALKQFLKETGSQ